MIGHDPSPSGPWRAPPPPTPAVVDRSREAAPSSSTQRPVIVLDAAPDRGSRLAFALEKLGLHPRLVRDPVEAMQQVSCCSPALVVVQVPLREISEVVLLETLRRISGSRPVPVVVTSEVYDGSGPEIRALLQRGAAAFLPPPSTGRLWRNVLAQLGQLPAAAAGGAPQAAPSRPVRPPAPTPPPLVEGRRRPARPGAAPTHASLKLGSEAPDGAVEGTMYVTGADAPVLVWDYEPSVLLVVSTAPGPETGQDLRLQLHLQEVVDGAPVDRAVRILATVQRVVPRPWGCLVRMRIRGVVPPEDFDAVLAYALKLGAWALP